MSIRAMTLLVAAILLCTADAASAATKRQKTTVYRSAPRAQAAVPRAGPTFDPNSPAAAGGGSLGYNQNLYNW
jgi:hypothetical protein